MQPRAKPPSKKPLVFFVGVIFATFLVVAVAYVLFHHPSQKPGSNQSQSGASNNTNSQQSQPPAFNKTMYATDRAGSIWWVVNKTRPLNPKDYAPSDLKTPNIPLRLGAGADEMKVSGQMAPPMEKMVAAAKTEGINLMLASGYRSYALQVSVYNQNIKQLGQAGADKVSAKPGTSEHQTGLAADLEPASRKCEVDVCFGDLPEGKWLAANAYKYGFIIRYTAAKESVTGYSFEPWHVRYVGIDLSTEMHKQNIETLEEFFGLPSGLPAN